MNLRYIRSTILGLISKTHYNATPQYDIMYSIKYSVAQTLPPQDIDYGNLGNQGKIIRTAIFVSKTTLA